MSATDKVKNVAEHVKGTAKEAAGAVTGDNETKRAGRNEQRKADVKQAGEKVKDTLGE